MPDSPDNQAVGSNEPLPIKFYYDFKSPFTFLAFDPALDLERTHRVRLRFIPYLFDFEAYGGALEVRDERSWRKVRYLYRDVRRFASERGIIIRGPQKLYDSRLALMSGLFADHHGKFREAQKCLAAAVCVAPLRRTSKYRHYTVCLPTVPHRNTVEDCV